MYNWVSPKTSKRESHIGGYGLFATYYIRKGEKVVVWGGHILRSSQLRELAVSTDGHETPVDISAVAVGRDFAIAKLHAEELDGGDYINHSCNPNCGIDGRITVVARRRIKPNEEITIDYAMVDLHLEYEFNCACGADSCRRVVTGNDWRREDLQRKYRGYFARPIQQQIDMQRVEPI
ncbi:MAG: SET domain-containing protein [Candidatus Aenigmarchaeota archaeon]|nr:SET domain-containing protein [Candidatus Aenigmarchaeota archaeon]